MSLFSSLPARSLPWLGRLLTGLVLGLGAYALYQVGQGFLLRPPAVVDMGLSDPREAAERVAPGHLFGTAVTRGGESATATGDLRLVGVLADHHGNASAALVQREGDSRPLVVTSREADGLRLIRADRRAVTLDVQGREVSLSLPDTSQKPVAP